MTPDVQLYQINTPDELERSGLAALARGHGQRIAPPYPVYSAWIGGKLKAAFHIRRTPILYPALHLVPVTPREFVTLCRHVLPAYKAGFPGGLIVSDIEYPQGGVTPEKLSKVGLTLFPHLVYEFCPETS
jgi:hypothetical protein